jgi:uncharacterized membrane protein
MKHAPEDPLVVAGRREAAFALLLSLVAMLYSVSYCVAFGYGGEADKLTYVLWFPNWVFWGIVVPWVACVLISSVYAMCFMKDADLSREGADDATAANANGEPAP